MANRYYDADNAIRAQNRLRGIGDSFVVSGVEERDLTYLLGPDAYGPDVPPTEAEFAVAKHLRESLKKGQAALTSAQQADVRTIITYLDTWYNKERALGAS